METTTTTAAAGWPEALASVADAYAAAATIGGGHASGSLEEGEFNDAAAAIGDAINALVETPAPDFAAVAKKLDLLAQEFGGGDAEQLQAIAEDLVRLAGLPAANSESPTTTTTEGE